MAKQMMIEMAVTLHEDIYDPVQRGIACQQQCQRQMQHSGCEGADSHSISKRTCTTNVLYTHRVDSLAHGDPCTHSIAQRSSGSCAHRRCGDGRGRIASGERPCLNGLGRHLVDAVADTKPFASCGPAQMKGGMPAYGSCSVRV